MDKNFLNPENMKTLGFDVVKNKNPYISYKNDGTKHRNKDYNSQCPEPRGKVTVDVNLAYSIDVAYVHIMQDGGTRVCYAGICPSEEFLESVLNNIR